MPSTSELRWHLGLPFFSLENHCLWEPLSGSKMLLIAKKCKPSAHSACPGGIFTSANQLPMGELKGVQAAKLNGLGPGCMHPTSQVCFPGRKCHGYTDCPWLSGNRQPPFGRLYIYGSNQSQTEHGGGGTTEHGETSFPRLPKE